MVNMCRVCGKILNDLDEVEMTIQGKYRFIKSTNSFALYKSGLIYVPESLRHIDCEETECLS